MRIDKFLKNSRLIKRRTVAKDACDQGRVFINDKAAKAGSEVKVGDVIRMNLEIALFPLRFLSLSELVKGSRSNNV